MNNLFLLITFLACVGSVQAGVISVADVTPASLVAGASGAAVATFTTATTIPADGKFVVIFPSGFDVSGATVTAITGQGTAGTGHTISCASLTCTVTRGAAGTPTALTAGVTTITFGVVKNPTVSGNTGTFTITTQDNGGTEIDTLATVQLVAITAGVIGTADVTPASLVAGASGVAVATFTTANPVPANGKFVVIFPTGFDISSATVTAITGQTGAAGSGHTISCAVLTCTVTRGATGTPAIFTPGVTTVTFGVVKNPTVSGNTGTFTITTQDNAGTAIDTLATVPLVAITAGVISTADVTPASLVAGASGAAVATFTTANPVPANGKFVVIFPTGFDVSGATVTAITGQTGAAGSGHTISCASLTCTVTRGATGTPAIFTPGVTTVTFGVVKNPTVSGNTGTFTITTQNNAGTTIDTLATVPLVAITAVAADPTFSPASGNVTTGSALTLTSANAANICLRSGTTAPTCNADGTCGTGSTAYNATAKPTITAAITWKAIGCAGTGNTDSAVVTAAYDAVAATTTAAPAAATTTVSGASSEAAWSTMLTVFAIAMAAFSTL